MLGAHAAYAECWAIFVQQANFNLLGTATFLNMPWSLVKTPLLHAKIV